MCSVLARGVMKTMTVGELKAHFSEMLSQVVEGGDPVAISYGRKKETVAAIVPYSMLDKSEPRPLGVMKGRGRCVVHDDFAVSDEEMLGV
jgi:prevent-host-death family protein